MKKISSLSVLLKKNRKNLLLSQSDLAEKIQSTQSYVAQLERGAIPSIETAKLLCEALNLEEKEILRIIEQEKYNKDTEKAKKIIIRKFDKFSKNYQGDLVSPDSIESFSKYFSTPSEVEKIESSSLRTTIATLNFWGDYIAVKFFENWEYIVKERMSSGVTYTILYPAGIPEVEERASFVKNNYKAYSNVRVIPCPGLETYFTFLNSKEIVLYNLESYEDDGKYNVGYIIDFFNSVETYNNFDSVIHVKMTPETLRNATNLVNKKIILSNI